MVQRVGRCVVAEKASAGSCGRSCGGIRQREEAAEDVYSTGYGGLAVPLDSASAELGEVRKTFRPILTVKGIPFEEAECLLGIPGCLSRDQIEFVDRDISPRVTRAVRPGLPSLRRMEVRGPT